MSDKKRASRYKKSPWKEMIATIVLVTIISILQIIFRIPLWLSAPIIAVLLFFITFRRIRNWIKLNIEYRKALKDAQKTISLIHEACNRMEKLISPKYSQSLASLVEIVKSQDFKDYLLRRLDELERERRLILDVSDYFSRHPIKEWEIIVPLANYVEWIAKEFIRLTESFFNARKDDNMYKSREEDYKSFVHDFDQFFQWYKDVLLKSILLIHVPQKVLR